MNEHLASSTNITISDLSLKFPYSDLYVLKNLSMEIKINGWTCLLGTSGCGKTTLLKYLSGILPLEMTSSGSVSHPFESHLSQNVAYMAQEDNLLPWLTIIENVLLPFRFTRQHNIPENREKALALLESVGLKENIESMPAQLSGGMRQRAALARTLIQEKPVVLMDEPFSALDAVTRYRLQDLSFSLLKSKTVFLITHDPLEAIKLANNLFILQGHPTHAYNLDLPVSEPPREINNTTGTLHNKVVQILEQRI